MTEKENLLRRVLHAITEHIKAIRFYLVIGILSISVIFGAGILNLWKDLVEGQREWLEIDETYLQGYLPQMKDLIKDDLTAENLLDLTAAIGDYDIILYNAVDHLYVYDSRTGDTIGDGDTAQASQLFELSARSTKLTHGRLYGTLPFDDRYTIILEVSTELSRAMLLGILPQSLLYLGISFALYLLLLWIIMAVFKDKERRDRAISAVLLLILTFLIILDASVAVTSQWSHIASMEDAIYRNADLELSTIAGFSASDIEQYAETSDIGTGRQLLIEAEMKNYSSFTDSITYDPATVLDESIPIEERIQVTMNTDNLRNSILEYLLETVMYAILSVIIFWGIVYYQNDLSIDQKHDEPDNGIRLSIDRLKLIITVKGFADALMITVVAKLLKSFLTTEVSADHLDHAVSWMVAIATWVAVAVILLIPRMVHVFGGSRKLLPFSIAVCSFGSLLCYTADTSLTYMTGYLLLAASDTVFGLMYLMVPYEMMPPDQEYWKETSKISIGRRGGEIVGFVVGGTLLAIIPYRYIFLIVFIVLLCTLIPAIRIAGTPQRNFLPEQPHFFEAIRNRRFCMFLLLIVTPYAMVGYYFKYVVPLNVDDLGVTATLVSFLFFFRMLMKLIFKRVEQLKAFWRQFSSKTAVLICMFSVAVIFFLMNEFNTVPAMILLTMLLAVVESRYVSMLIRHGYDLLGNGMQGFFGFSESSSIGIQLSRAIAAPLIGVFGALIIPSWMGGAALLYILASLCRGLKQD